MVMLPQVIFKKTLEKITRSVATRSFRKRDLTCDTRLSENAPLIRSSCIDISELDISAIERETAEFLLEMYLDHRFDLLGSGWVRNGHNTRVVGVEGHIYKSALAIRDIDKEGGWLDQVLLPPHRPSSRNIWQRVSPDYKPIDWQRDFKSGHRWDSRMWYSDQPVTPAPGADIKVPWELARMQHLPQMAILCMVLPEYRSAVLRSFKNQVLDFIAANPPRMGVNWVCTMDVAIRAANMLFAYDLFRQMDSDRMLDGTFDQVFANSIHEHGLHIVNNLEWSDKLTTNHYLADIAGLLFVAVYLDRDAETDCWLAFSIQELLTETKKQFYEDGGNFESSTSYHCLSTQLVLSASALVLGLNNDKRTALTKYDHTLWKNKPPLKPAAKQEFNINTTHVFPIWFIERLFQAARFIANITKPDGEIPQIGDNDSGRLFHFTPAGEFLTTEQAKQRYLNLANYGEQLDRYWDENMLIHQPLLSAAGCLFADVAFEEASREFPLEQSIIRSLTNGRTLPSSESKRKTSSAVTESSAIDNDVYCHSRQTVIKATDKLRPTLTEGLRIITYPDFGFYLFVSERLHLTICATPVGQHGYGGHSHNDKLSFELMLDGKNITVDPGTYLYTALPNRRNQFRSVQAHAVSLADGKEQNCWLEGYCGLFGMKSESECVLLNAGQAHVTIGLSYRQVKQIRRFEIHDSSIVITDYCNRPLSDSIPRFELYSNGYGKLMHRHR